MRLLRKMWCRRRGLPRCANSRARTARCDLGLSGSFATSPPIRGAIAKRVRATSRRREKANLWPLRSPTWSPRPRVSNGWSPRCWRLRNRIAALFCCVTTKDCLPPRSLGVATFLRAPCVGRSVQVFSYCARSWMQKRTVIGVPGARRCCRWPGSSRCKKLRPLVRCLRLLAIALAHRS